MIADDIEVDTNILLLYARYMGDLLNDHSLLVRHCGGDKDNIRVEALRLDIGRFNAQSCTNLLDADRIFIVKNDEFGFTFVAANGKHSEWYNRLGTLMWSLVFGQEDNIYGDVLLIKNEDFADD